MNLSRIATNLRCCSSADTCRPGPRSQARKLSTSRRRVVRLSRRTCSMPRCALYGKGGSEHHGLGHDEGPLLAQPGQQGQRLLIDEARRPLRADLPLSAHSNSNPLESPLASSPPGPGPSFPAPWPGPHVAGTPVARPAVAQPVAVRLRPRRRVGAAGVGHGVHRRQASRPATAPTATAGRGDDPGGRGRAGPGRRAAGPGAAGLSVAGGRPTADRVVCCTAGRGRIGHVAGAGRGRACEPQRWRPRGRRS